MTCTECVSHGCVDCGVRRCVGCGDSARLCRKCRISVDPDEPPAPPKLQVPVDQKGPPAPSKPEAKHTVKRSRSPGVPPDEDQRQQKQQRVDPPRPPPPPAKTLVIFSVGPSIYNNTLFYLVKDFELLGFRKDDCKDRAKLVQFVRDVRTKGTRVRSDAWIRTHVDKIVGVDVPHEDWVSTNQS